LESLLRIAPRFVLVHDSARPFASSALIERAIETVRKNGAAVPATTVSDTIKRVDTTGNITATIDRSSLRAIQTPQAFAYQPLLNAHRSAASGGRDDFTDDAALMEWAGVPVATFEGELQT
jgi:2-C-methyl-D-erythritol 4-phosphate cytidylyltransferase/2-C-methyl-D-erythritol 2,4-cyclodiphosphate synthase